VNVHLAPLDHHPLDDGADEALPFSNGNVASV
jgi:hypothetical protein